MTRYSGLVGFSKEPTEDVPGVWTQGYTERRMNGSVVQARLVFSAVDKVNEDLNLSNQISVIGDKYSFENSQKIRYAEYMGQRWAVTSVAIERPRLVLTLGGVWNE